MKAEDQGSGGDTTQREALEPGDRFPRLTAKNVSGDVATIPDDFGDTSLVLLFYRGHW